MATFGAFLLNEFYLVTVRTCVFLMGVMTTLVPPTFISERSLFLKNGLFETSPSQSCFCGGAALFIGL